MNIPLARPDITEQEIEAVVQVLKTPYLSLGPKLEEFVKHEGRVLQINIPRDLREFVPTSWYVAESNRH